MADRCVCVWTYSSLKPHQWCIILFSLLSSQKNAADCFCPFSGWVIIAPFQLCHVCFFLWYYELHWISFLLMPILMNQKTLCLYICVWICACMYNHFLLFCLYSCYITQNFNNICFLSQFNVFGVKALSETFLTWETSLSSMNVKIKILMVFVFPRFLCNIWVDSQETYDNLRKRPYKEKLKNEDHIWIRPGTSCSFRVNWWVSSWGEKRREPSLTYRWGLQNLD